MSNQSVGNRVHEALKQAVAAKLLPSDVQERAEKLLSRIEKPVRVGLLGMPGSGKTSLLNLLVGRDVLPEDAQLPTLQLTYGDEPRSIITLPDGSKETRVNVDGDAIADASPVFVEMEMPLPALRKISLLEVVAPADPTAMHRAGQWAAKKSDVIIWCTQGFPAIEQQLWAPMPDIIKDHALLMVTKADQLQAQGLLDDAVATIRSVASEEFSQILPISTTQALASRELDGTVDKALMKQSGGSALISAVLKQVEMGRQTAVDQADILLHQHADILKKLQPAKEGTADEETVPVEEPDTSDDDLAQANEDVLKSVISATSNGKAAKPAASTADIKSEPVSGPSAEDDAPRLHEETRKAYQHVIDYIVQHSRDMIDMAAESGDAAPSQIIASTVEHVQWMSDYLMENGHDADDALQQARDTSMDAADLVQLMQMEKRDSAAIEALSLMLQIKHELQAELAA